MTLKQKAKHYQNGGKYLAQEEEDAYVLKNLNKWYKNWMKSRKKFEKDYISFDNYLGIHIGMWQAQHGFVRPYKVKKKR